MNQALKDRYLPTTELASHGAVTTWRGVDRGTGRDVIIKVLDVARVEVAQEVDLFVRQGETLRALSHPRIPALVDAFECDVRGKPCHILVMAYVEGRPVDAPGRVRNEQQVLDLALEVADLLAYLHGLLPPVIHRDVKPANLLQDQHGHVHLLDLGAVTSARSEHTVVGTWGYMPPEQYTGHVTPASDVYALGVTLVHLVTGKAPWEHAASPRDVARALTTVKPVFRDALVRMTSPVVEERPRDGAAARKLLEQVRDGHAGAPRARWIAAGALASVAASAAVAWVVLRPAALPPVPTPVPVHASTTPSSLPVQAPAAVGGLIPPGLGISHRCFLRGVPRLLQSRERYYSWVQPERGPDCTERYITYGLYSGYSDALDHCARAAAMARQDPNAYGAFRMTELEPLVRDGILRAEAMSDHYDQRAYVDDGCRRARAEHPLLRRTFESLAVLAPAVEDALFAEDIRVLGLESRAEHQVTARFLLAAVELAQLAPRSGKEPLHAEFGTRARAVLEAYDDVERGIPAGGEGPRGWSSARGVGHAVKQAVRRIRENARLVLEPGYDPLRVRAAVHEAVVDLHVFQR